jgi:hypothetical protein
MGDGGGGGDIIIKGGSVELVFSEQMFSGQNGRYGNQHKKIASIEVRDDNTGDRQTVNIPENGKCTIRINTR